MEPVGFAVLTGLYSAIAIAVAAVTAVIVGRRRGIDQVSRQADEASDRLKADLGARVALLEADNARLTTQVRDLVAQVAALTRDLHVSDAEVRRLSSALADTRGDHR